MRKERAECVGGEENYFAQILNEADEWPSQCVKKSSEHLLSCLDTQRLRFCFWGKLCRNCANETQIERELAKDSPGFAWSVGRARDESASGLKLRAPHFDAKRNAGLRGSQS